MRKDFRLEDLLLNSGKITKEQLEIAVNKQRSSRNKKLVEVLIELGYVTEEDMLDLFNKYLDIPIVDLFNYNLDPKIIALIPESIARKYNLLPINIEDGELLIVMNDPFNIFAIDDIKLLTGMKVKISLSSSYSINKMINKYYTREGTKKAIEEFEENLLSSNIDEVDENDLSDVNSAPVVRLVNSLIGQAVNMRASDIHIEPFENDIRIRFRLDGDLQEILKLSKKSHLSIVTRIKIMGKMDIAERRLPQDGRLEMEVEGRIIDMRISSLPTIYGEKIVIRLLDRDSFCYKKEDLGFSSENLRLFNKMIKQPYGIILVTGPTGSGKTTTLYTILKELNQEEKNIITVEDPVEYKIHGINQIQVNIKAGLTFSNGLRSILRQDPDIIMVGEIRDSETAEIAIRASITGHLVLSTIHTNDTASTIIRLIDMGVEPYLVSSSITGIISQRLVKVLCNSCKTSYLASEEEKKLMGISEQNDIRLFKANGCNKCIKGYRGRTAVHEVLFMDEKIRKIVNNKASADEIKNVAVKNGMETLFKNAVNLALKGITSVDEVLKVGLTVD